MQTNTPKVAPKTNKASKRGKNYGHHSGHHGGAREAKTEANKARREKSQAKWLAKRQERKSTGLTEDVGGPKGSNITPSLRSLQYHENPEFTVLVKASQSRVESVRVEAVHEPEKGNASIVLITKAGKKWKMHFNEFSFVFPARRAAAA
jgi:hypothetical protein